MQISVNEENWSNFRDSLNSDLTRQIYEQCLNRFLLYCDSDLESMLKLEPQKITNLIIKYISELRISFQYKNQILCAIKHACEMNDVLLNWAKIKKFNKREKTDNAINGKDRPYTHKEIQQILEYADERAKCAFTLLASTGCRIGALPSIKIGDLEKIDNLYKVTVYAGDKEEYFTFTSPECAKQIDSYLQYRERRGETINQDSYLFVRKFSNLTMQKGKPFNDIIGLPEKNNIEHPIYDYELDVIDKIESNHNIWIKKSRGIGITELVLRYLAWKIVCSNELEYKKIMIVSGTMLKHANDVKERMQSLFERKFPLIRLESKFTELWIKNTNIICMPSRNVKDLRGYTDVSYMFIDEADYFEPSVNNELLHSITAYEEKSKCTTIMASTPNRPGGLFETIEKDPNSKYCKIKLDYTVGLDKIYDRKEIEKKKSEPEFLREYAGHYLGKVGNLFLPSQIQTCINLGKEYSIDKIPVSLYTLKSVGIDPGFSSSATGIVVLEHIKPNNMKDRIRVIETYNIEKGDPNQIVELCWSIYKEQNWMNTYFFIDGSNRAMVNLLKIKWQESLSWEDKQSFGPNTRIRCIV